MFMFFSHHFLQKESNNEQKFPRRPDQMTSSLFLSSHTPHTRTVSFLEIKTRDSEKRTDIFFSGVPYAHFPIQKYIICQTSSSGPIPPKQLTLILVNTVGNLLCTEPKLLGSVLILILIIRYSNI